MPKPKKNIEKSEETKEIIVDDEEKVLDPELVPGDILTDDEDMDDEGIPDDDEVNPFGDRWEE
ncbi:hypothetical protein EB001_13320 [bacterium]|nr:hypothetical protein [bacterium]